MVEENGIVYSVAVETWKKVPKMSLQRLDSEHGSAAMEDLPHDTTTMRVEQEMEVGEKTLGEPRVSFDKFEESCPDEPN